jgi:predicted MFS family arabinose efflux permease
MSWLKKEIRGEDRGPAMSLMGGSLRVATIIGPLAGGFIAEKTGYRTLFALQGLFSMLALLVILSGISRTERNNEAYTRSLHSAAGRWKINRGTILAAAAGIAGLTVLRATRGILIPLWGGELGLSEGHVGIVMFTGGILDASLFWISGILMTRRGRKTTAILCTSVLALAVGLIPLAGSFRSLLLISALAGLGNALGAGINLTISGDLAPKDSPAAFMSFWRFFMGFAGFGGPALAAWVIAAAGTLAAPPLTAALGFSGALLMVFFMKETGEH